MRRKALLKSVVADRIWTSHMKDCWMTNEPTTKLINPLAIVFTGPKDARKQNIFVDIFLFSVGFLEFSQ